MQKEVDTHTKKKYFWIKYETFHIIFVMALYPLNFGEKNKKKDMMCIYVNLKYHNHITFNQWILHLTYIYPKMKIKPEFKEVLAIKNKSTIT